MIRCIKRINRATDLFTTTAISVKKVLTGVGIFVYFHMRVNTVVSVAVTFQEVVASGHLFFGQFMVKGTAGNLACPLNHSTEKERKLRQ